MKCRVAQYSVNLFGQYFIQNWSWVTRSTAGCTVCCTVSHKILHQIPTIHDQQQSFRRQTLPKVNEDVKGSPEVTSQRAESRLGVVLGLDLLDEGVHDAEELAPRLLDEGRGGGACTRLQELGEHGGQVLGKEQMTSQGK